MFCNPFFFKILNKNKYVHFLNLAYCFDMEIDFVMKENFLTFVSLLQLFGLCFFG